MSSRFYKNVIALSRSPEGFEAIEISEPNTVVAEPTTTVVDGPATTVVVESATTVVADSPPERFWRAESNGVLFPSSRVRRIGRAQDALTHVEECVYDYLWGKKNTAKDEVRTTQAGYDRIAKAARITKRNAALIIERLIEKGFVALDRPADQLNRIPSQYRVLSYKAALEELSRRKRHWIVRSGNGVLFVHPQDIAAVPATTVVVESPTTVVAGPSTTVVAATTDTVVVEQSTTVVATTTHLDNKEKPDSQSSSALADTCRKAGIVLDAAAERTIQRRCRSYDKAAIDEEVAYFADIKIHQLRKSRNVGNLVGLLITAIPEYFVAPAHELQRYRAEKAQQQLKYKTLAGKIMTDPQATEEERLWASALLVNG